MKHWFEFIQNETKLAINSLQSFAIWCVKITITSLLRFIIWGILFLAPILIFLFLAFHAGKNWVANRISTNPTVTSQAGKPIQQVNLPPVRSLLYELKYWVRELKRRSA